MVVGTISRVEVDGVNRILLRCLLQFRTYNRITPQTKTTTGSQTLPYGSLSLTPNELSIDSASPSTSPHQTRLLTIPSNPPHRTPPRSGVTPLLLPLHLPLNLRNQQRTIHLLNSERSRVPQLEEEGEVARTFGATRGAGEEVVREVREGSAIFGLDRRRGEGNVCCCCRSGRERVVLNDTTIYLGHELNHYLKWLSVGLD